MDENSIDALRNPRGCTGQFSASTEPGKPFSFMPSSIQLFSYGVGDWLPPEAGYFTPAEKERASFEMAIGAIGEKKTFFEANEAVDRIRSEFMLVAPYYEIFIKEKDGAFRTRCEPRSQYIASPVDSDCGPGGDLCERDRAFLITGLAARIGRVRDRETFQPFLDRHDLRIREALASAISIQVEYGHVGCRYRLGSLLTWPLLNSIFGPAADLEGARIQPSQSKPGTLPSAKLEDAAKMFMPFQSPAYAMPSSPAPQRKVSIRLSIEKEIQFANDPEMPRAMLVVPVQVWLFGSVMLVPQFNCGQPYDSFSPADLAMIRKRLTSAT